MSKKNIRIRLNEAVDTSEKRNSLYFGGDFALYSVDNDTTVDELFSDSVHKQIRESDVSVINYEGVTAPEIINQTSNTGGLYIDEHCPSLLADAGFTGVSLANNHMYDYGPEGLIQTVQNCQDCELKTVGAGHSIEKAAVPERFEFGELTVSVFAFSEHSYDQSIDIRDDSDPFISDVSHPKVMQKITEEKKKQISL